MTESEIKRRLRELKRLELMERYGFSYDYIKKNSATIADNNISLVWNEFFGLCSPKAGTSHTRYPMKELVEKSKEELEQIYDEYWFFVYYRIYNDRGMQMLDMPAPELLTYLELPMNADITMVKKRFHELCKKYHPDEGGNNEKFIELMEIMKKLNFK